MERTAFLIAVASCFLPASNAWAESAWDTNKAVMQVAVDINGDGLPEKIRLTPLGERDKSGRWFFGGAFRLSVNGQTIFDRLQDAETIRGFYLADIDRTDRYKEIVIHAFVPSDYFSSMVYRYDGQKLRRVGRLAGEWAVFRGNGTVLESHWRDFWRFKLKYVLRSNHTLALVPRKFYPVRIAGTVVKPLPLYARRGGETVVASLPVGRKVKIVKSDLKGWYLIQSVKGSRGWAQEDEVSSDLAGFPRAD